MLDLRVFGGLALENGGQPIGGSAAQRSRLAILAMLAANGFRAVSRDRIVALCWPDKDREAAHGALRQALYTLRRDTGEQDLTIGSAELRLNPAVVRSDVGAFDAALKARDLERAVSWYTGPFLDGVLLRGAPEFERWAETERDHRASQHRSALETLAMAADANGDSRKAVDLWKALCSLDPLRASYALAVMHAHVRAGNAPAAVLHARSYEKALLSELGLAPDGAILDFAERIRATSDTHATRHTQHPEAHEVLRGRDPETAAFAAQPQAGERDVSRLLRRAQAALVGGAALALFVAMLLAPDAARNAPGDVRPAPSRTAIAVLPFQNLSADSSHAYLASGLHDELLTQLSKVADLTVISRLSVMAYTGTSVPRPLKRIARDLGAGSVVEGSVQVVGNRLRVRVQLIDAGTDAHVWAEYYDRTLDDAFAVQSDLAWRVVQAVSAALTDAEARELAAPYTANAQAYRLYLQGREYYNRPAFAKADVDIAQGLFERAIAIDPRFALAHAALSQVHGWQFFLYYDRSPSRVERQRVEAETALRLAPDLPQAHLALGSWYYHSRGDYPRALAELRRAVARLPNDADVWARIGQVTRRMGEWDESAAAHAKTTQLSPQAAGFFKELGVTYMWMRRYSDSRAAYDDALTLAPDIQFPQLLKALTYVYQAGQLDTLRALLGSRPWTPNGSAWSIAALNLLFWDRSADSMVQIASTAHAGVFEAPNVFLPSALYAAWAHRLRGDERAARSAFASARVFLDSAMKEHPDDERVRAARGFALAGLGDREEALREARWLEQAVAYRTDKFQGSHLVADRAIILAQVGDADAAMDDIENLLGRPSPVSVHVLRLDPRWDAMRGNARFQSMLAKYAARR